MQWWGNLGSAVAGLSTLVIALGALVGAILHGPKLIRASIEQAEALRAERRRGLSGWSSMGINTYDVALVTSEVEQEAALRAIRNGGQTDYVVLRMRGGPPSGRFAAASPA